VNEYSFLTQWPRGTSTTQSADKTSVLQDLLKEDSAYWIALLYLEPLASVAQ